MSDIPQQPAMSTAHTPAAVAQAANLIRHEMARTLVEFDVTALVTDPYSGRSRELYGAALAYRSALQYLTQTDPDVIDAEVELLWPAAMVHHLEILRGALEPFERASNAEPWEAETAAALRTEIVAAERLSSVADRPPKCSICGRRGCEHQQVDQ